MKVETICLVDESGCIRPSFDLGGMSEYTAGILKYFFRLKGKRVKITIEVLDE